MDLCPYLFSLSFYLLYFFLPPFEDNGLLFWVPDVLCQHSEVVLWNLLSIQMFFWWICGGESSLPVLFLHHLRTAFAFNLSQHQGLFKWSALCIRWPKYWSFSFNINPSDEYSGLISFRMDWLDLLAVKGTLKSLLQHHSSNASILQCSAFFILQFSHPYMTVEKTIALTRWTFVGKVMSLLLNMLSRLVITFLSRN